MQAPALDGLDLDDRLVALDRHQQVAGLHQVAGSLEPFGDLAAVHRQSQLRHNDFNSHDPCLKRSSL
jgi:hypothetical protein